MKILKLFFLPALIFFSFQAFSQSRLSAKEIKKQYHYTFSGDLCSQSKQSLEENLSSLKFVNSAKVKYKNDSQSGEIFIQTTEITATSEEDQGFDLIALKKLILSFNITPIELNVTQ